MLAADPLRSVKRKVLIVDDEESILRSTGALLEDMGFATALVHDARDIVAAALRERPDVVLQDIRMPGLDLERLVRELRAQPPLADLPIVLFSASMEAAQIAERIGAHGFLEKPFRPAELVGALEAVC